MDVFARNKRKANAMGISRFMDDPNYRKDLIKAADKSKSEALKKQKHHGGGHGDMGRALYFKRKKGEVRY